MAGKFCCAIAIVVTTCSVVFRAQEPAAPHDSFQVASVKANKTGESAMQFDVQGSRLAVANIPLKQLIRAAYTLQLYQIVNAPPWVDSERFDVIATADADLTVTAPWTPGGSFAPLQFMLQSLLAERFKMKAHEEMRSSQVYSLVADKPGKLTPASRACTTGCGMRIGPGTLEARGVPLPQLAELISQTTGRVVRDATGLKGNFDFNLQWSHDGQTGSADAPSIFTAVQEQLGLKLVSGSGPVPHLVIDHIERPDPD